jgi:hypothetical protein
VAKKTALRLTWRLRATISTSLGSHVVISPSALASASAMEFSVLLLEERACYALPRDGQI